MKRGRSISILAWGGTVTRLPALMFIAMRRGGLPLGASAFNTVRKEGFESIHWKVLGDALVRVFQHSGPVLTKLGQILATRADLLPPPVCARLEALYTEQPPMSPSELARILKQAYPKGLPFAFFEKEPLAVGSVGQVHRARLTAGEAVIVKLVRPHARPLIERDVALAYAASSALMKVLRCRRSTKLMIRRVIEDLEEAFLSELDLKKEAKAIDSFRSRQMANSQVCIPKLYRNLSNASALVIEELKGEPLSAVRERAKTDPAAAKRAASLALKEILLQVFDDGRFHADPHGGNLLLLEDGRLGIVDFGLTGEFTAEDRQKIGRAVKAFLAREPDGVIQALLAFGSLPKEFDYESFKREIGEVVARKNGNLESLVDHLFRVAYAHEILVPRSTTLLIKTLVTVEGVARSLDPDINLVATAIPVVLRSLTPKWLRIREWFRA